MQAVKMLHAYKKNRIPVASKATITRLAGHLGNSGKKVRVFLIPNAKKGVHPK